MSKQHMLKGLTCRIYPNKSQRALIDNTIDASRWVYNDGLEQKNTAYEKDKTVLSHYDLMKRLPELKEEHGWLKNADSQALQQTLIDQHQAFKNFFKGIAERPHFKSKRKPKQAYRNPHGNLVRIEGNRVCIPKMMEGVRFVSGRGITKGEIRSYTVRRTNTGKYFISFLIQTGEGLPQKPPIMSTTALGVDVGIKDYAITSDGEKIGNPKYLRQVIERIGVLQRRMRRRKKGSKNFDKAKKQIALLHEKVANQRKDFIHKLTTKLIRENQTLCLEELNNSGMVKNHKLAMSILDAAWGEFLRQCLYKADWYGVNILLIPAFKPSTIICHVCDTITRGLTLNDREWTCSCCNTHHDRDINAAKSIKKYCLTHSPDVIRGVPVEMSDFNDESMKQEVVNYL